MPNPSNLKERAKKLGNTAKKWHLHDPGFFLHNIRQLETQEEEEERGEGGKNNLSYCFEN